jgi:arylsulfatase A-like enzyme
MMATLLALAFAVTGCGDSSGTNPKLSPSGKDAPGLQQVRFQGPSDATVVYKGKEANDSEKAGQTQQTGRQGLSGEEKKDEQPNIVLVVTDDLDLKTARAMPRLQDVMAEEGVTFDNAFVTNPLCCPSRATTLRGQYAQNTLVQGNQPPQGGYEKFHALGREKSTVATWLDGAGYQTAYMGKYMNGYQGTTVPPGWDDWLAVSGNYLSDDLTFNGQLLPGALKGLQETDVLSRKSSLYIERASKGKSPFFLTLAPRAPHQPAIPAPRYAESYSGAAVPAEPSDDPSYNEADMSDKPLWLRQRAPLTQKQKLHMERLNRDRLRSMKSVEDMMVNLKETLKKTGELDNTYIVFTSDHGFHMGQHRLPIGKWTAYEEDIRIPLMVRGPGVPEGEHRKQMALNNDFAPTFADLAGARPPQFVDGRSLAPLLQGEAPPGPTREDSQGNRKAFLVEAGRFFPGAGAGPVLDRPRLDAVRTEDYLYVEYETGARELYNLRTDPDQLENRLAPGSPEPDPKTVVRLARRLDALRGCSGEDCRKAETADFSGTS